MVVAVVAAVVEVTVGGKEERKALGRAVSVKAKNGSSGGKRRWRHMEARLSLTSKRMCLTFHLPL